MHRPPTPPACSTLVELARLQAQSHPRRRIYTFLRAGEAADSHLSLGQLDLRARRIAARLQQIYAPGDRVLLAYASASEFVPAFFGCLYAGVVAVPADAPAGSNDLHRLAELATAASAVGLCTGSAGFNARHLALAMPALQRQLRCVTTTDEAALPPAHAWAEPALAPDSLAYLKFTAGSTGRARGVCISHANVLHNLRRIGAALDTTAASRALTWLAPHDDMALVGHVLQPLHLGIPSVLMSPAAFVAKPVRWLQALSDHGTTISGGPSFAYELCLRRITSEQMKSLDLSRWTVAYNGAELVRPETMERFADKFAPCGFRREAFVACYGLAESTLLVSASARTTFPPVRALDGDALQRQRVRAAGAAPGHVRRVVSCGVPAGAQVAIVDPERCVPCEADRVGEVWIRADATVSAGYWNDPEATRHTFQAQLADGDGPWLRTGDLGFVQDGELHITCRLGDLVHVDGRSCYAGEIEDLVRASHPALRDGQAAVFAVGPRGDGGVVVMHELQRGSWGRLPLDRIESAARSAVRARLGVDLQRMHFVPEGTLPKTPNGKLRRGASREAWLNEARPGAQAPAGAPGEGVQAA